MIEQFIEKAKKIHGNKYDYSKVEYVNNHTKVCIICPEHGEFWQLPSKHLSKHGCQLCNESHLEKTIRVLLDENNIKYIYQANKKNFTWLNKQSLDFYLPDYNVAIECQGEQHYKPVDFGFNNQNKAEINFLKILENDLKKKKLCYKHNIKLFYFTNESLKNEYEFSSIKKLLKALKSI